MEADLQRHYHIDYRDRWRGDLTLRRIWALITHLPPEAATLTALRGSPHWTAEAHLLDDVRMTVAALGGEKRPKLHPDRPRGGRRAKITPERARKIADARRRSRARRKRLAESHG